jgi:hypothetical protein
MIPAALALTQSFMFGDERTSLYLLVAFEDVPWSTILEAQTI